MKSKKIEIFFFFKNHLLFSIGPFRERLRQTVDFLEDLVIPFF